MSTLQPWFEKGLTDFTYLHNMTVHQENLLKVYNSVSVSDEEKATLRTLQHKKIKAIVLTADWCGDAMVNVPIFLRLAQEALIETRFLIRDENLELMDQYLTNGTARSIPIFIFIDEDGNEIGKWGPRSPKAQEVADALKANLPEKNSPEFEAAFKEFATKISATFTTDQELWEDIKKDMLKALL